MALLNIINNVQAEIGLPQSLTVVGNVDSTVVTLLALANREGKDLSDRFPWQALINEATFTTVATESQGNIFTLAPGFKFIINNTMWDRTQQVPLLGSLSAQKWGNLKALNVTGPYSQFRMEGNLVKFIPVPAAGHTVAFDYMSSLWCQSSGGTGQTAWAADTDTGILEEDLMTLGLHWRYLRSKGLAYAEQFNEYERSVNDAMSRDGGHMWLNMNANRYRRTSPFVQEGNWSI